MGATDVEAIEAATAAYIREDFAQGSEMARDTAIARLRVTLPLLGAQMAPEVRAPALPRHRSPGDDGGLDEL